MGFSSDNPNTVGNMLQSYVASSSPLLGAGLNAVAGNTTDPYGVNKDGGHSVGVFGQAAPTATGGLAQAVFGVQPTQPQAAQPQPTPQAGVPGFLANLYGYHGQG